MRREVTYLSVVAVAAPLAVSAPQQHATEITITGGSGSYAVVTRGCEGVISKYRVDYDNAAADVSHKFPSAFRIGARAGTLDLGGISDATGNVNPYLSSSDATRYVNPYLSLDWTGFSIGAGWLHGDGPIPENGDGNNDTSVSGHIRIGKAKKYFALSYFEDVPLATAGYATAGFGGGGRKFHMWLGTGVIPYDHFGFVGRFDYRLAGGLSLGVTGRLGGSESISENAFALRLSYLWSHGGEPTPPPAPALPPAGTPPQETPPAPQDSSGKF